MARRRFRHSPRFDSPNERSFQEYILNTPAPVTTRSELLRLIRGGEDTYLELKVKLSNPEKIAQGIVALANTAGGTVIFGVSDQLRVEGVNNPEGVQEEIVRICREEIVPPVIPLIDVISFDNGRRVVALDIDGKRRPYRTRDGRFYVRVGAEKREIGRDELSAWLDEIRPLAYENMPVPGFEESDFDDGLLWSFADEFEVDSLGKNLYQTADFLKKDLLMAIGNGDEFIPTVAGVLLFGKNERVVKALPRSRVRVERVSGANGDRQIVESVEIGGNLAHIFEEAERFVKRYCDLKKAQPKRGKFGDSPVTPRHQYHYFSVIEAIINSLIHRDLAIRDTPTRIAIYDDAIEFVNPRRTNGFAPPASRA
ncbi:MAG TPA: putative DNA binding domain-containing protein, partial [Pyrinomonadaceae bacterium]|nr:putative DNA binding domain-containing protein [Pyrinomonadaceae bacterium]